MKKLKLLNSKTYRGKTYTVIDGTGFESLEKHNLPIGFYGGRVDKIAKTNVKGLYMCMEDMAVIDLLLDEVKPELNTLTNKELASMVEARGIRLPKKYTKQTLIDLLND